MSHGLSRRDVLKASAVGMAALAGAPLLASRPPGPNDRIRFALIGVGGRGGAHLEPCAKFGEIVALCDIDAQTRSKAMLQHPGAATFTDFRRMLEGMASHIDAVVVSTPDHTHAPAAAMAMKLGKHVYCEKPLTRTVWEARRLAQIARKAKVATQMGNQGTAGADLRRAAAHIRSGTLGVVREVHCWTNRAGRWWPQGVERPATKARPKHVDFDTWLGPSTARDYADGYHPFAWRGWWDFGSGALGDIGCHCMNLPFMALDLRDPVAITAETSGHNSDSFPSWSVVTYEFGVRGPRPALNLIWYDGGKLPPADLAPGIDLSDNGCLIVGEKATLYCPGEYGQQGRIVGGEALPEIQFEASPGHFAEWVEAMRGGKPARSNFVDYSGPLTETVLLGNLAVWASGERIEWDARKMTTRNASRFAPLLEPAYRKGWSL